MAKIQKARTQFGQPKNKIRLEMDRYESFFIPEKMSISFSGGRIMK